MFKKGGRSLIVIVVLGALIFFAVSMFVAGLANDQEVVVAKVPISAGTRLTASLLEVKRINASAALPNGFTTVKELDGQLLVSARMPGDQITQAMVGDKAISTIAASLQPGKAAIAIKVDQATGLAGIVRVGDLVGVVGIVTAQDLDLPDVRTSTAVVTPVAIAVSPVLTGTVRATPTPRAPLGASARIALNDLRVLVVPQSFRYEETAPSSSGDTFSTARSTAGQQTSSVIVLEVPLTPIEITPGYIASPAELLAMLNSKGKLHLYLQSTTKGQPVITKGVDAQELMTRFYGKTDQ
jgi:Flp pilus assembly protein CpaB